MSAEPHIPMSDEREPGVAGQQSAAGTEEQQQSRPKRRQRTASTLSGIWQGRILSLDLFKRNVFFIIAVTGMMLMYIANKFDCQSKMQEVMKLKTELENAKTDCVNASARYNSLIRESHMKAYVDTMHIDLSNPETPPYHLTKQ
ncbi:MAG: hypothetical protein IJT30_10490 [Muribaculaceae bacterium]|nr:hypothetical protein [Muribaculaceae bacterium]